MTATPRYFTGRVRSEAGEVDLELASMDDPEHFGPVFHRLTFAQAIERDLLSDYQVVIVGVDDPTYRAYAEKGRLVTREGAKVENARTLAAQIGLAKTARDHDLRRIISFHGRVKKSQEFAASFPDVVAWMPDSERLSGVIHADYVSGEMPSGTRRHQTQQPPEPGPRRTLSAGQRSLSCRGSRRPGPGRRGLHRPAAFHHRHCPSRRPGYSQVRGQECRYDRSPGLRRADGGVESALDSSAFKPVWDVLRALRAHDETLAEQLDSLRREMGRGTVGTLALPGRIVLDLPVTVEEEFVRAFEARLVEQVTASWEFWFGLLLGFAEREGTCPSSRSKVVRATSG